MAGVMGQEINLEHAPQGRPAGWHKLVQASSCKEQQERRTKCNGWHSIAPCPADMCLKVHDEQGGNLHAIHTSQKSTLGTHTDCTQPARIWQNA